MPPANQPPPPGHYGAGRLSARPSRAVAPVLAVGDHTPADGDGWSGVLFVSGAVAAGAPLPLMVALHGAGGNGLRLLERWRQLAERHALAVLAPDSKSTTWDVLRGGYGPDVERIDRALAYAFARLPIDPSHVLIEGFSDGASYALSLAIANGDLFTHVLANSPGFCHPPAQVGRPLLLLTHGTDDQVLPINYCSRMLAPQLERAGYDVTYHEFDGGHHLLPEIMALSLNWAGVPAKPEERA